MTPLRKFNYVSEESAANHAKITIVAKLVAEKLWPGRGLALSDHCQTRQRIRRLCRRQLIQRARQVSSISDVHTDAAYPSWPSRKRVHVVSTVLVSSGDPDSAD